MMRPLIAASMLLVLTAPAVAQEPVRDVAVTFAAASDQLSDQARADINGFASAWLSQPTKGVSVYGYASVVEVAGGTLEAAEVFSQRRADGVREALVAAGVPRGVITSYGLGAADREGVPATSPTNQRAEIFPSYADGW